MAGDNGPHIPHVSCDENGSRLKHDGLLERG
jgi:hypothetical protein